MLPAPIMMVCVGNMCRSPFAEFYLNHLLTEAGVAATTYSRGLAAPPSSRPPTLAMHISLEEYGLDMSGHRSQQLGKFDVDRAGLILVMEPPHRQQISKVNPTAMGKIMLLSQSLPPPLKGNPIADPMGKDETFYRDCYRTIAQGLDEWAKRFGLKLPEKAVAAIG